MCATVCLYFILCLFPTIYLQDIISDWENKNLLRLQHYLFNETLLNRVSEVAVH